MTNKKIIIFDFCETLVGFQTADAFVDYVRLAVRDKRVDYLETINLAIRKTRILRILEILTGYKLSLHKRLKLMQLNGLKRAVLEKLAYNFYKEEIKPHIINKTANILKKYQELGYEIWLISGGYGIYLKYFTEEYKIDKMISTNIRFVNNICQGSIDGTDCIRQNKIKLFMVEACGNKELKVVASYSDSKSDIPILRIADNPVVVSRKHQTWVDKNNFNEIFW